MNTSSGTITSKARLLMCTLDQAQSGQCQGSCANQNTSKATCVNIQAVHVHVTMQCTSYDQFLVCFYIQVKGIKGASILAAHKHFNLSTGAVLDVMRCVFLGVIEKTLMNFWLDVRHRSASDESFITTCIYLAK